jgi:hypothetical protein
VRARLANASAESFVRPLIDTCLPSVVNDSCSAQKHYLMSRTAKSDFRLDSAWTPDPNNTTFATPGRANTSAAAPAPIRYVFWVFWGCWDERSLPAPVRMAVTELPSTTAFAIPFRHQGYCYFNNGICHFKMLLVLITVPVVGSRASSVPVIDGNLRIVIFQWNQFWYPRALFWGYTEAILTPSWFVFWRWLPINKVVPFGVLTLILSGSKPN